VGAVTLPLSPKEGCKWRSIVEKKESVAKGNGQAYAEKKAFRAFAEDSSIAV
jgi:hypothetical protein